MAETPLYTPETETQIAQGLSFLPGSSPDVSAFSPAARAVYLKRLRTSVDQNFGAQPDISEGTDLSGPVRTTQGAKDIARKVAMDIKANPDLFNDPLYIQPYQSLLGLSGLALDDDFTTVSDGERSELDQLIDSLRADISLTDAFDRNAGQTRAAIEAANLSAEQQAQLEAARDDAKAGLVYAGYLDADNANDPAAYTLALKQLIADTTPQREWDATQSRVFANGKGGEFSADAATFIRDRLASLAPNPDAFKADLESGDEARISNAQHYLSLMGADVDVNGVYDRKTADAALAELHKPLEMPSGILYGDRVDHRALTGLAARGDIALPEMTQDSLAKWMSPEDAEIAMTYPLAAEGADPTKMSREAYVAERMIGDDPATYQAFLAEENARRATLTIDANVVLPPVAVPVDATLEEERIDIAQNPAGLHNVEPQDVILDSAKPIAEMIQNDGVGITDRSGYVVFNDQNIPLAGVMDALMKDNGLSGDGEADGKISMQGALLVVAQFNEQDVSNPATLSEDSNDVMDYLHTAGFLEGKDNYAVKSQFDLSNPADREMLMRGIVSYADLQTTKGIDARMNGTTLADVSTLGREDVSAAITQAASLTEKDAPAISPEYDLQTPRLRQHFDSARDMLISRDDPAMSSTPDNKNTAPVMKLDLAG